jgi:hypothetical protein
MSESERTRVFYRAKPNASVPTLRLKFKARDALSLCYIHLLSQNYDITGSIELQFSTAKVVIEGKNLEELSEAIDEQSVQFIREADPENDVPGPRGIFIRSITVTPVTPAN